MVPLRPSIFETCASDVDSTFAKHFETQKWKEYAGLNQTEGVTMPEFKKIAETAQIPQGTGKVVELDGNQIAIWNVGGSFQAFQNVCPHRGGPVGEGELEGNIITCPWHGWQFDIVTGQSTFNPAAKLTNYDVQVEGTDVKVAV
jgi:nitrite reductase (NADH) small subunit